ncbi:MAG: DUF7144 family membrane protein [Jiangellaceae bacterium]
MAQREVTGWVGWVWFAGLMMIMVGFVTAFYGVIALFNDDYVARVEDSLVFLDLTAWGWIHLLLGAVAVLVGLALLAGQAWARVIGVVVVMLNMIAHFWGLAGANPWWSLAAIAVDAVIIYAIVIHGAESRDLAE